jgi:hypothetical protein
VFVGAALTAGPTQAITSVGSYYPMPSWDQTLPSATRFIILLNFAGAAVLDRETGLVWEKTPQTEQVGGWFEARRTCINKNVGGRKSWRLPSIPELASLIDPNVGSSPKLPSGHPFTGVESAGYWSATANAEDPPASTWFVNLNDGFVHNLDKSDSAHVWCVRGPMNADAY